MRTVVASSSGSRKALNRLPSAIVVEAHGSTSGGDPDSLPAAILRPVTEGRQQKSPDATPTLVGTHDHPETPTANDRALFDVELPETHGAHGPTICGDSHPTDREMDPSGLVTRHRYPERGISGLWRTTPFAPAHETDLGYQVRVIPEKAHGRRHFEGQSHIGDDSHTTPLSNAGYRISSGGRLPPVNLTPVGLRCGVCW